MIDRDCVPIDHVPPRRRIDITHPGRKRIIGLLDVVNGVHRIPDAAAYRFDHQSDCWILKK